ncbi:MAG: hypothetical protein LAP21_27200 [Acidobacteriia bacterium]|nr:hypothetical protein [Terriglobia bacterium]
MTAISRKICGSFLIRLALMSAVFASFTSDALAQNIAGTYSLVKDSDGQVPKKNANVTITFRGPGALSMSAVQPGETVTDTGTYSVRGNLITLHFKELVWAASRQPFTLEGCTLTLPFMALKDTGVPGSSIWQKQGCSTDRSADKAAGGPGSGTQSNAAAASGSSAKGQSGRGSSSSAQMADGSKSAGQAGRNNSAPPPGKNNPGNASGNAKQIDIGKSKKPSCLACEYVPCIRESIEQKKKLKEVYGRLVAEFGKFYFQTNAKGEREPVDTINGGATSLEDFQYLLKVHASYTEKENEWTSTIEAPPSCHYDSSLNLQLSTHAFNCQLDVAAANVLESAVPCHELYDLAIAHEQVHINACLGRKDKGKPRGDLLITPAGKAREEMAAYDMEIAKLTDLLHAAEAKCRFTCRCTGERFSTSAECQANCPISLRCPVAAANSCIYPDDQKTKPLLMPRPR